MRRLFGPSAGVLVGVMLVATARADEKPVAGEEVTRQPGQIVPAETVRISPRVGGVVREVLVEEGAPVKAGQVLARLDGAESELELRRAAAAVDRARAAAAEVEAQIARGRAAIDEAEAVVKEASAQRRFQGQKVERLRELLKNRSVDQRLVDEAEAHSQMADARLRQAEARLMALRAESGRERLAVARADVAAAEAQRDLAKLRLDATVIRSPIDGTVLARRATAGDSVAGPSEGPRLSLFEVADLTRLDAVIDLPGNLYNRVAVGAPCEVQVDATPARTYTGRVVRVAPALSPATRAAPVRVRIDIPAGDTALRPGMYGAVRVFAR